MIPEIDGIIRLLMAIILGGIVGYERQSRNKSAGLRTHILVSLGSCLVMIVSLNVSLNFFFTYGLTNADPERIAAQVVSGIGFLGAGTIFANKNGLNVVGLTTAASLWVVAAIGLASGAGYWITACATTIFVYLILTILSRLDRRISACSPTICEYDFVITTTNIPGQIGNIGDYFGKNSISIRQFHTASRGEKMNLDVFISVETPINVTAHQIISGLLTVEGIIAARKGTELE